MDNRGHRPVAHHRRQRRPSRGAFRLARAAARHAVTHGKRGGVSYGAGEVIGSACVPTADTDEALAALLALEAGDPWPAEALTARYTRTDSQELCHDRD